MEIKSYTEYRPPYIITSSVMYYLLGTIILLLIFIIHIGILCWISSDYNFIDNLTKNIVLFIGLHYLCIIRPRLARTLVHTNGYLEILFMGNSFLKKIAINDIKRIEIKKNWSILYGDAIILLLTQANGSLSRICIKENKDFLTELKRYNPNIIIQEIPII